MDSTFHGTSWIVGADLPPLIALVGAVVLVGIFLLKKGFSSGGRPPPPPRPFWLDGALVALYKGDLPDASFQSHGKGGPVYARYFLGRDTVYVSGASNIRKILIGENTLVESLWPPAIRSLLGSASLSNNGGAVHARLRKMMQPAFTPHAIHKYLPRIVETSSADLNSWAGVEGPISGYKVVNSLALRIAIRVIAGSRGSWTSEQGFDKVEHLVHIWLHGLFSWPIDLPWTRFGKAWTARRQLNKLVEESLTATRSEQREDTVLEVMLDARDEATTPPTQQELLDNVMTLLFAGHDTSATAMVCILEEMRRHPEKLDELKREQEEVHRRFGDAFTPEVLTSMPLTEGWIKETMRRTPVVPVVPRTSVAEFEVGGYTLRRGQGVVASIRACMQQDPRFEMDDPQRFKPERWLNKDAARDGAWMPFGGGPRLCLGNLLSLAELKIFLSLLIRGYDVEFHDHAEPWHFIPLAKPLHGMPITVRRRGTRLS